MIDSPTPNVVLTAEQSLQILEWHKRLSTIQTDITIGEKNLVALKKDIENQTRHIAYLEDVKKNLDSKIEELTSKRDALQSEIINLEKEKEAHYHSMSEREARILNMEQEATEKAKELKVGHEELESQKSAHREKETTLIERQTQVDIARKALAEAIKNVTWNS